MGCSICHNSLCVKHSPLECPDLKMLFCPHCAVYGHRAGCCPTGEIRLEFSPVAMRKFLTEKGLPISGHKNKNIQTIQLWGTLQKPALRLVFVEPPGPARGKPKHQQNAIQQQDI